MSAERRLDAPRPRSLRYAVHAGILFTVLGFFRLFPLDRASEMGAWFGRSVLARLRANDKASLETLRTAYPGLGDEAAAMVLAGTYEHIGRIIAEISHDDDFTGAAGRKRFTFTGVEHIEAARALGRGMLLVTGHFGNWELLPAALTHLGFEASTVTRPPNNPWVAEWIARRRARLGVKHQIPKGPEGVRTLFAALRRKEAVAMFIDQQLDEGIPAPLFGRDAMTTHAPATLAMKLGLPVVPFAIRRTRGANFVVVIRPPIPLPHTGSPGRDILEMTTALNRFIEEEVRLRPHHWLWMHRRWRTAPLTRRASQVVGDAAQPLSEGTDENRFPPAAAALRRPGPPSTGSRHQGL